MPCVKIPLSSFLPELSRSSEGVSDFENYAYLDATYVDVRRATLAFDGFFF